jgi:uncharacterized protein (TIGR00369 family)
MAKMTPAELSTFLSREFPQCTPERLRVESAGGGRARLRRIVGEDDLRPGGTVSGPTMMALVDNAVYVALLAEIGPVALAVTTSLNINFLRKPPAGADVIAEAQLLKLGKRLAVGEVTLRSDGLADPVAHATATYSIPPPVQRR